MPHAELLPDGTIAVDTAHHEAEAMKIVPGARWNRAERHWTIPLAWGPIVAFKGVFGQNATAGPQLTAWVSETYQRLILPAHHLRTAQDAQGDPDLYPLQRVGVEFLCTVGSTILGDDMGTGKTVQAAVALRELAAAWEDAEVHGAGDLTPRVLPALIVCPQPVRRNWARELEKWAPDLRVVVAEGNATKRRKAIAQVRDGEADVLVINWENLWGHSRCASYGGTRLKRCEDCGEPEDSASSARSCEAHEKELNEVPWVTVIADEAHRAANPKAKSTRALWWLGDRAERRWALTGTSVKDHLDSAYGILRFVSPEDWPSFVKMRDRYCLTSYNPWSGGADVIGVRPDMEAELFSILDPRLLRRTKAEAMPWLPPKVRVRRYVTLSPKHRKAYDAVRDDLLADLDGGQLIAWNPLEQGLRLSQIACAFPEVDDDGNVTLTRPSPKVDEVLAILDELGEHRPCVVFSPSLQVLTLLKEALDKAKIPWASVDGDTAHIDRETGIDAFQAGKVRVMLLTAAGAEGITLTRADTIVFMQRPWSLIQSQQAEDRVHRGGSEVHESITVIDIVAEDTVDERILDALTAKAEGAEEILRDAERVAHLLKGDTP